MKIYKYSYGEYGIYLHMHHQIGYTVPARVLKTYKRRNHARKFAKCFNIRRTK